MSLFGSVQFINHTYMVAQLCFLYLGFKFSPDSISANNVVQTWHRIIEAVKFGYAYRPFLGDPDFHPEVEEVGNVHISRILAKTAVSAFLIITFAKTSCLYVGSLQIL